MDGNPGGEVGENDLGEDKKTGANSPLYASKDMPGLRKNRSANKKGHNRGRPGSSPLPFIVPLDYGRSKIEAYCRSASIRESKNPTQTADCTSDLSFWRKVANDRQKLLTPLHLPWQIAEKSRIFALRIVPNLTLFRKLPRNFVDFFLCCCLWCNNDARRDFFVL